MTAEKNSALVRNAEIAQQVELAKQDMRRQEAEVNELMSRISRLEDENKAFRDKESKNPKQELTNRILTLEEQLENKNKVSRYPLICRTRLIITPT